MGIQYERALGPSEGPLKCLLSSTTMREMEHLGADKAKQECRFRKRKQKAQEQRSHLNQHGGAGETGDSTQSCAGGGRKEESGTFWKPEAKPQQQISVYKLSRQPENPLHGWSHQLRRVLPALLPHAPWRASWS